MDPLRVDSPFFPTIVLFENRIRFPEFSGYFLERFGSLGSDFGNGKGSTRDPRVPRDPRDPLLHRPGELRQQPTLGTGLLVVRAPAVGACHPSKAVCANVHVETPGDRLNP